MTYSKRQVSPRVTAKSFPNSTSIHTIGKPLSQAPQDDEWVVITNQKLPKKTRPQQWIFVAISFIKQ